MRTKGEILHFFGHLWGGGGVGLVGFGDFGGAFLLHLPSYSLLSPNHFSVPITCFWSLLYQAASDSFPVTPPGLSTSSLPVDLPR